MISQTTTSIAPGPTLRRLAYATLATLLLVTIVFEAFTNGTGYWQIAVFAFAPDLALFYGASSGLAKGQLHPRAVGAYNLMHRFWGPLVLFVLAAFGLVGLGLLIGALTWAFHVALDRAIGYGLRTRDGFQRP
jgi:hypothetical protein